MFSGNQKISSRQLYRNYTVGFISLSGLLIPLIMDRTHMVSILAALGALGLFLAGSVRVRRPSSTVLKALCYAHYWVLGTMIARMAGLLIQEFLLTGTSLALILVWLYLFFYYNLYKGLECRLRVSEVLFPFFLSLLILLSGMMLGEVEPERCLELQWSMDRNQWRTGYQCFCWLSAVQSLWHLNGRIAGSRFTGTKDKQSSPAVRNVWLTGSAAAVLFGLFTYSIYGDAGHTGLVFPLASAMTLAHFPGNVIGRLDALFVFAWVIGLFLLCSTLFAPLRDEEPDIREKYLLFALLAASLAAALQPECMEWGQKFLYWISMPVQILMLFYQWMNKTGKKVMAACLALILVWFCTGCGQQELEERSMVTAIGVESGEARAYRLTFGFGTAAEEDGEKPFETDADSLGEAETQYWEAEQKNMDFNHLKNIYFSEEIMGSDAFADLLEEFQLGAAYSRGTSVYVVLGSVTEEVEKEEQSRTGMPIHRLLNALYNRESCEIPTITEEQTYKGKVTWSY